MTESSASSVKRERRKSLFLQEIIAIIRDLAEQEPVIADIYVSNVDISPNSGICYVYFSSFKEPGQEVFLKALDVLKLYKTSLRKNFVQRVNMRYGPELVFLFDAAKERERIVNDLLNKIHDELPPVDDTGNDE